MDSLQRKLIGALVGLARATDGNEHLITPDSTAVVLACLNAKPSGEEDLQFYLSRVGEAKKKMVPDCFLCANPCGRTDAYDLNRLEQEKPDIRETKYRILKELRALAEKQPDKTQEQRLYSGLIAIGLDGYTAEELYSIFSFEQT